MKETPCFLPASLLAKLNGLSAGHAAELKEDIEEVQTIGHEQVAMQIKAISGCSLRRTIGWIVLRTHSMGKRYGSGMGDAVILWALILVFGMNSYELIPVRSEADIFVSFTALRFDVLNVTVSSLLVRFCGPSLNACWNIILNAK